MEPLQGVIPLDRAWGSFLMQRACMLFEGMLVLHTFLTDPTLSTRTDWRNDPSTRTKDGKLMRLNQPQLHSNGKRTHGITRAIVDVVTCDRLLPMQHRYSSNVSSSRYLDACWPDLADDVINKLQLEADATLTVGSGSDVPVNPVLKVLSVAVSLGRLPTCASGAVMLTDKELEWARSRVCPGRVPRIPVGHMRASAPPSDMDIPPALDALVRGGAGRGAAPLSVVNQTLMARMEVWFLAADTGSKEGGTVASSWKQLGQHVPLLPPHHEIPLWGHRQLAPVCRGPAFGSGKH